MSMHRISHHVQHAEAPPTSHGLLQRKCACGAHTPRGSICGKCEQPEAGLQRKLAVGSGYDPLEREADRIAAQAMRGSVTDRIRTASANLSRASGDFAQLQEEVPASVHEVLRSPGQPLSTSLRADMETRFGHDFSRVRIHSGGAAAKSAREVHARAFTVGNDIVFGSGNAAATTPAATHLLAHELTHVIQQDGERPTTLQRQREEIEQAGEDLKNMGEEEARKMLRSIGSLPGTGQLFAGDCKNKNFCNPFKGLDKDSIETLRTTLLIPVLIGISMKVNSKVRPVWHDYLLGGSSPQDFTSSFAADFSASKDTARTTEFIIRQLKKEIARNHKAIMGSAPIVTVDLTPRMTRTLAAIDDPKNDHAMVFKEIKEVPGNLAGGIGKDQAATKIGAKPSPFNDARTATIGAKLTRTAGKIQVEPNIIYKIQDTADLCPGDCGAETEQDATVPMSRFEASGVSGDVPFTIQFPAPPSALTAFDVAAPGGKTPSNGKGKKAPPKKASLEGSAGGASEAIALSVPIESTDLEPEFVNKAEVVEITDVEEEPMA